MNDDYPVQFSVDYGDGSRNRLTTLFRIIMIIPILVVLMAVTYSSVVFAALLMILFREKYPKWMFDFQLEALRLNARVSAYLYLLTDGYPSTDEEQSVHLDVAYPDAGCGSEQVHAADQVAVGDTALYRVDHLGNYRPDSHDHCVVRDHNHGQVPKRHVQLRCGCVSLDLSSNRLRVPARDGSLPSIPSQSVKRSSISGFGSSTALQLVERVDSAAQSDAYLADEFASQKAVPALDVPP